MTKLAYLALVLGACTGSGDSGPPEVKSDLARDKNPNVTDQQMTELVTGNTEFAADLYGQVRTQPGNLFMSPHSISTALAMTYAGAKTETAAQMATTMHFTLPPADLFAAQDALDLALASRAHDGTSSQTRPFELHTANSIWGQTGKSFVSDFLDTLAVNYGAGLYVLDFAADPETARGTINDWVAQQTHDKIQDVLPQGSITDNTALVLTNAIYFNAAWAKPFDVGETADRPFTVAGAAVSVPSVHGFIEGSYAEGDGWKAGELPYDGGKLAMDIIVPDDLAAFEGTLTAAQLSAITGSMQGANLETTLPKFSFTSPFDLGDALKALGMTDAFTYGAADFSGIDGMLDLLIAKVLHKGFVAVDEAGTEAAAATAVVIEPGSSPPQFSLTVDKPFVFLIRDLPTGEILFVGRVTDPRS